MSSQFYQYCAVPVNLKARFDRQVSDVMVSKLLRPTIIGARIEMRCQWRVSLVMRFLD